MLYGVAAIAAFLVTEIGRSVYRPYIYEAGINDLGIADSIGNLGGIVVQIMVSFAILNPRGRKAYNVIGFLVVGYIAYEFLQPHLPRGVFDWKDVYGTIIGAAVSIVVLLLIRSLVRNNRVLVRL